MLPRGMIGVVAVRRHAVWWWSLVLGVVACRTAEPSLGEPDAANLAAEEASDESSAHEPVDEEPGPSEPAGAVERPPVAVDAALPATGLPPLTEEQLALFHGSVEDAIPEHRGGVAPSVENKHYVSSNEKTLEAFYDDLRGVGGGYVGVGTDQGYLFASWARFELAWFIDYDPVIQDVHELYRLAFMHAQTPEEFLALWDEPARDEMLALIEAEHEGKRLRSLRYWLRNAAPRIHARLVRTRRRLAKQGIPSYLGDQEHYDHLRQMLAQRRIRPLLVNLLDDEGLVDLGRRAEALEVPIRVLYLSNAEEYWKRYSRQYRDNLAALPFADDAVVLRTLLSKAANDDYRYNVQPAANYQQWLARPFIGTVYQIVRGGPTAAPTGITRFVTDGDPDASRAARRYAAKHDR